MADIKFDTKARRAVLDALEVWANQLFENQTGEWTAVVTFGHAARTEEVKTEDEFDYLARTVKIRILDAEIVTGPHKDTVEEARLAARTQRETAGTLLEGAFDDHN